MELRILRLVRAPLSVVRGGSWWNDTLVPHAHTALSRRARTHTRNLARRQLQILATKMAESDQKSITSWKSRENLVQVRD